MITILLLFCFVVVFGSVLGNVLDRSHRHYPLYMPEEANEAPQLPDISDDFVHESWKEIVNQLH